MHLYLERGQAVKSGGVHSFGGDVGDVGDEVLQVATGLFQVGGVDDDLHQLQPENHSCWEPFPATLHAREHKSICWYLRQAYVGLLDEVLQGAAERSRQEQVGGLSQHVVNLC